jgi:hypothetical protein
VGLNVASLALAFHLSSAEQYTWNLFLAAECEAFAVLVGENALQT